MLNILSLLIAVSQRCTSYLNLPLIFEAPVPLQWILDRST